MSLLRTGSRTRTAVLVLTTAGVLALPACSDDSEQPAVASDVPDIRDEDDLADPFSGPYGEDFLADAEGYVDLEVTLAADVAEVLSERSFTITSPEGEDVEPLLVLTEEPLEGLEPGGSVLVAGTPRDDFELPAVEDDLGVDLPDEEYEAWEGELYLTATEVELQDG